MSALGIITGYPDGTFKPNKPITRAEFAAIAARFDETQSGKSATFSDVIGHWAAKEIGIAYYNDWIKGYPDGTFKPDQNITRAVYRRKLFNGKLGCGRNVIVRGRFL